MSGGDNLDDVLLGEHPIDSEIRSRHEELQQQIKQNGFFSRKTLFLLGAIILACVAFGSSCRGMLSASYNLNVGSLFRFVLAAGGAAFCIYNYLTMRDKKNRAKVEKADFHANNEKLKQRIYQLIQDDSIPEEGKGETIAGWLNEHSSSYSSSDVQRTQTGREFDDNLKRRIIRATVITVTAVIAVILLRSVLHC